MDEDMGIFKAEGDSAVNNIVDKPVIVNSVKYCLKGIILYTTHFSTSGGVHIILTLCPLLSLCFVLKSTRNWHPFVAPHMTHYIPFLVVRVHGNNILGIYFF
jgi:hypothetical protein